MDSIRIIQLPTKSAAGTDDYIAVDSTANGTKKIQFPNLLDDEFEKAKLEARRPLRELLQFLKPELMKPQGRQ